MGQMKGIRSLGWALLDTFLLFQFESLIQHESEEFSLVRNSTQFSVSFHMQVHCNFLVREKCLKSLIPINLSS